jgi:hypothetical protein
MTDIMRPREERLPGGNVGGAVRAGSTMRRTAGPHIALHDTIREFAAGGIPAFVAMSGTHHSEEPPRDRAHLLAHRAALSPRR